jgi:hypothetical protein
MRVGHRPAIDPPWMKLCMQPGVGKALPLPLWEGGVSLDSCEERSDAAIPCLTSIQPFVAQGIASLLRSSQ